MPLSYIETNNEFDNFKGNKNIFNIFKNIYLFSEKQKNIYLFKNIFYFNKKFDYLYKY
jgi:hypothetical protein